MASAKQQLGKIIREVGDVFTVAAAASCLEEPSDKMAKSLSRWAKQGWLTRVKRGLYAVVPIDASTTERVLEDAWVLIPELYGSCYVGGWSAAALKNIRVASTRIFPRSGIMPDVWKMERFSSVWVFWQKDTWVKNMNW